MLEEFVHMQILKTRWIQPYEIWFITHKHRLSLYPQSLPPESCKPVSPGLLMTRLGIYSYQHTCSSLESQSPLNPHTKQQTRAIGRHASQCTGWATIHAQLVQHLFPFFSNVISEVGPLLYLMEQAGKRSELTGKKRGWPDPVVASVQLIYRHWICG